jgi:hypothetical protein
MKLEPVARAMFAHDADPILWCDHTDATRNCYRDYARIAAEMIREQVLEEAATRLLELAREERNLDGATLSRAAEYLRALKEPPQKHGIGVGVNFP